MTVGTEEPGAVVRGDLGRALDNHLATFARCGLLGAVLVLDRGEVVLRKAFGFRDSEARVPNSVRTLFPFGSITKQFVAAAILRLDADGRIAISDTIDGVIGALKSPYEPPRIHDLLTHTAGIIRAGTTFPSRSASEFLFRLAATPRESPPGERWRYSNAGYATLFAIIERVTGQAGDRAIEQLILHPAGMVGTRFVDVDRPPGPDVARGHVIADPRFWATLSRSEIVEEPDSSTAASLVPEMSLDWSTRAAGGMVGTLADVEAWEHTLASGVVLPPAAIRALFAPHFIIAPGRTQGYAWRAAPTRLGVVHFLDGDHRGYQAAWLRYPDRGLVMFFAANVSGGADQAGWRPILRHRFEELSAGHQ
jgi:CubicO group peptidase (beta-lactamase class C family)